MKLLKKIYFVKMKFLHVLQAACFIGYVSGHATPVPSDQPSAAPSNVDLPKTKPLLQNYSLLQSFTENKSSFTHQEIKGADTSRKLQEYLYYPGVNAYKDMSHII